MDACTVTALDAITAFAIPNPGSPSQSQPVFSGLVALQVALLSGSLSLLRTDKFYSSILSAVDVEQTKQLPQRCQCNFQCENEISVHEIVENTELLRLLVLLGLETRSWRASQLGRIL